MDKWDLWFESIHRFGDLEAISVPFTPSIRFLQDKGFCKTLEKDLKNFGTNWEKRIATKNLSDLLPDYPGLYMFVWKNTEISFVVDTDKSENFNWCLYIGQAGANQSQNTIKSRYKNEYASYIDSPPDGFWDDAHKNDRKSRIQLLLSLCKLEFWFLTVADRSKIESLESRLIRAFRPPGNQIGKNTLRPRKPVAAFKEY